MTAELVHEAEERSPLSGESPAPAPVPPGPPPSRRRLRVGRWAALAVVVLLGLLLLALGTVRYGARTDAGRSLVVRLLDGMKLGPLGRLHIAGLEGDPFGDLTLDRLQIVDARGPWLDAARLSVRWSPGELLARRAHVESLRAASVRILRQPVLTPQPPSKPQPAPVSVAIDSFALRMETLPAFSVQHGLWDLTGGFAMARNGAMKGRLDGQSRLHAGDGASAAFQFGQDKRVQLRLDAVEASGGALAGALGLPADRRLVVHARAAGTTDAGELTLTSASGAATPLSASARWSRAGTTLNARVALDASRLTAGLAERAGPRADVTLEARHTAGDTYAMRAELTAARLSVVFSGPLDWRRRRTPGATLKLSIADLSKWAPIPVGPTHTGGTISGDLQRFTYKGAAAGEHLTEGGYSLGRLAGPATLARQGGEWRLQADFTGAGGSGQGLVPALLGPTPRMRLDGSRLSDGRFLVRELHLNGSGLKLDATGGQGLFGGLSFKGTADVSNIAAARPGARGRLTGSWSASRAKAAPGWSFSFDAAATDFGSGIANLDHLVGRSPRLKADAAYGPAGLSVARAELDGAALTLGAKGSLWAKGALGFDLDWQAKGPFEAGPLEIAGSAKGTGRLSGDLGAPKLDLTATLAAMDLGRLRVAPAHVTLVVLKDPNGFSGNLALAGSSSYGPATARAGFGIQGDGIDLHDISADAGGVRASGSIAIRNGAPSTADLAVDARTGAFLASGRLSGRAKLAARGGALSADLALDGQDLSLPGAPTTLHTLHLTADGPWTRLPFRLSAAGATPADWRFAGEGVLDQTGRARQLSLSGSGRLRRVEVRTLSPAVLRLDGPTRNLRLDLAVGGGRADVNFNQRPGGLDGAGVLKGVALSAFDADYTGELDADVKLSGRGGRLGGTAEATLKGARSKDAPANLALDGRATAALDGGRLHLVADATNAQGLKSQADVVLPAVAEVAPFRIAIDRTKPMQGSFAVDGELRPLWDLFIGGGQSLSGHVLAQGTLAGTINDPRATGQASLTNGRFQDVGTGLLLQNVDLRADFGQNQVRVRQATGSDSHGGTLAGSGAISLYRGGGSTFALKLTKFRLFDNDLGRASVSGDLTVERDAAGKAKLSGALRVDRADITAQPPTPSGVVPLDVIEIHKPGQEGAPAAPHRTRDSPIALDVSLTAPRGIFVRGRGLDVELSLNAHVGGTAAAPDLTGVANVVLGSYDFAGKRFDFDQRGEVRLASRPDQIRLDLTATREDPTLTAVVRVGGTAAKPEITLSSTPVLPQDEVLSQVLFGASASQLSPAQAAELASALASMAGGGGFDLLGRLRQFAGLDRLAIGAGTSGTGVSGGKYINDNVYIELTGGGREGPSASVEWRVRKNFSVISQLGAQGDAQLSIQFRRNY